MMLPRLSIRRPVAVTAIMLSAFVVGLYAFTRLPMDFLPGITYPLVKITVTWRGATPEEIEKNIAEPIERAMATVDSLDYLESTSREGSYTLDVNFQYGTDVDVAYQDVLAKMGLATRRLPPDIDPPVIFKADPSQLPVAQLAVSSQTLGPVQLRTWAEERLLDRYLAVPGVAGVEIAGGLEREIRVELDEKRLSSFGLSVLQALAALKQANLELLGGRITVGTREYIARTLGEFESIEEVRNTAIYSEPGGKVVRVRDVARVRDGHKDQRVMARLDGAPCVMLSLTKQAAANTVEVADAVARETDKILAGLPESIRIRFIENQADYIKDAVSGVRDAAIAAAILVVLIIYLFLGRLRQVLVMLVALPLTLVANFFLMELAGFSLNIFSLGGLVVAMGLVLDNSIVVLENITRHRAEDPTNPDFAVEGAAQVTKAIFAGTLSVLALFLPFLLVPGFATLLFRELILVVAGVVVLSLLVATTVTPMLAAKLLGGGGAPGGGRWVQALGRGFGRGLERVLNHRWLVVLVAVAALALGFVMFRRVGTEFLPRMDDGRLMIKVRMPTGTSVAETDRVIRRLEKAMEEQIARDTEAYGRNVVRSRFALSGAQIRGLLTFEVANEGEVDVYLVPASERPFTTKAYIKRIAPAMQRAAGPLARIRVTPMKVKGMRQKGFSDVEYLISGPDINVLDSLARRAVAELRGVPGLTGFDVSLDITKPEFEVRIDRERATELGLSVEDISSALRVLVDGAVATQYREGREHYDIRLVVPGRTLRSRQDVENLLIGASGGADHYLREMATVTPVVGPVEIVRENQVKQIAVGADVVGANVGQAAASAAAALDAIALPEGYELRPGGQIQMMRENFRVILIVMIGAFFFAFVALAVQFESWTTPILVLVCVPIAMVGMVAALTVTGAIMGATVIIGVVVVIGATVNDGVLLLTFADELRLAGRTPRDAIVRASVVRFRPRVMTTTTTIMGFLPLALNLGGGGDMLQPMAIAVIGGLMIEIAVVLVLMPALYLLRHHATPCG